MRCNVGINWNPVSIYYSHFHLAWFPFPFPFPRSIQLISHSHGNPMGIPFPWKFPLPCTPLNETWHKQPAVWQGRWKVRRVSYVVPKFHELPSTNGLKPDRSFTHPDCFVLSQSTTHPLSGINVASHSDSEWNGVGFVCSSDLKPQMLSRRAALSGNISL